MEQSAPKPIFLIYCYICSFLLVLLLTTNNKALAASPPIPSSSSSSSLVCKVGTNDNNSMAAECQVEAEESLLEMLITTGTDDDDDDDEVRDHGMRRRFAQERETQRYITPGALKKDKPVCNGGTSGEAYSSSCLPPPSNPHTRGCFKYYRCRSDS
ncbi:unnamed protein product [Linum trigynum]|uniref:Rapid ALkalinization Factor n=1 Tax=Linum trigynum TaxID=586398 RepID=A0AAV2G438_9ROSI